MQQESLSPPSYADHDPASLQLPSVPKHDIGSPQQNGVHLPDLRSLGLPEHSTGHTGEASHAQWQRNSNSVSPNFQPVSNVTARPLADVGSPMELSSQMSMEDLRHRDLSVSMEDADVRMAAEALSGLGNPDFFRSPRTASFPNYTSSAPSEKRHTSVWQSPQSEPLSEPLESPTEPLLRLITDSHPWLGNTISGSMIAYGGAKHYSPSFVRGTAEFMERNIGNPMVNTVGYVSRQTGVDGRIRKYLGERRLSDDGRSSGPDSKRRRVNGSSHASREADVEQGQAKVVESTSPPNEEHRVRANSQASHHSAMSGIESLPAYDDNRSPRYEELSPHASKNEIPPDTSETLPTLQSQRSLTSQVLETTAGLGVALSDSSLRSLKYSLSVLRSASEHINTIMQALKIVLEEYEQDQRCEDLLSANEKNSGSLNGSNGTSSISTSQEERSRRLAKRIKEYGDSIWDVLRQTINTISRYTGSALPENAASLVRRQLMSLPLRWRNAAASGSRTGSVASSSGSPSLESQSESQVVMGATRMMNFAKESLDMLSQVSLVVNGTVGSAEQWLESLGRQKREDSGPSGEPQLRLQQQQQQQPSLNEQGSAAGQHFNGDHKQAI